ncbi:MAG TPA: hypothetical protein VGG28_10275 [Kofleriaceae bacterium]|jgi:hypothetical protein
MRFVLLAVIAVASTASADTPRTTALADVAGEIGGGNGGFVIGLRPELMLAHYSDRDLEHGFGIAAAGELVREGGAGLLGGSLEVVQFHDLHRFEQSLGIYERLADHSTGATASIYVGLRADVENPPWEAHLGLRLVARSDRDETSVALLAQLDPVLFSRFAAAMLFAMVPHN